MSPARDTRRRHLSTSPFAERLARPVPAFQVDDRVTHDRFGVGRVIGVEPEVAVLVDFGSRTERIVSPFPKLSRF